jgi:hypothetical protein
MSLCLLFSTETDEGATGQSDDQQSLRLPLSGFIAATRPPHADFTFPPMLKALQSRKGLAQFQFRVLKTEIADYAVGCRIRHLAHQFGFRAELVSGMFEVQVHA